MVDVNAIKQRYSCIDYAKSIGLPIRRSGERCVSPLRSGASNSTSFVVNEDFFFDYGSGSGGDVIDFCALYEFNGDKGKAIRKLAAYTGVSDNGSSANWVKYTQNLCNQVQKWHESLLPSDYDYLHKRKITDETIERYKIGRTPEGRLSIPYFKNGYVAYYITRAMPGCKYPESKYRKQKTDDFNENIIFGLDTLENKPKDLLVIAEGAFDVLSYIQEGYPCISAITGNFSSAQMPQVLSLCEQFDKVFLVFDNDIKTHAGEKFTEKMAKILTANRIKYVVGYVPAGYKDVSECYEDGYDISKIIDDAVPDFEFLTKLLSTEKEFEEFIRRESRYMRKTEIIKLFSSVSRNQDFDSEWLAVLKKECTSAPNETYISEQVIKNHDLLYNPKIGFYEYNKKYWERIDDNVVKQYISDELGVYTTGAKLNSILTVIKSSVVSDVIMNSKPIMNFINGSLEYEPKINFRQHDKNDFCTFVLPYPYDKNAVSEKWNDFLMSVTDGDIKKICFLQDMCGYVLYTDNRLQKCFTLIGSGANGKSVFLNVISKIFGGEESGNVSNIEMSSLVKDFTAIHLMTSILNISSETKTNVNGAESVFKQIVAGDVISDCFKGKDKISFRPRAKMFIACNEFMESRDTTDGWLRRFCFVNFPVKFCENPKLPNERVINKNIETELTEVSELSGIFNWVMEGYAELKAVGYFNEPDDSEELKARYEAQINPLISFVEESAFPYTMTNSELYKKYKFWAEDSGHAQMSKTKFDRKITEVMKNHRKDYERYRTNSDRGYRKIDTDL